MRRRWVKVLSVIAVVLIGLFIAADRIAVHEVDDFIANKAESSYGFDGANGSYTTADVHGFPFLTQAASRELDDVTLTAGNLTAHDASPNGGELTISQAQFDLHDVQISSDLHSAESGRVTGAVTVGWQQLSYALTGQAGDTVTVVPLSTGGGPGTLSTGVRVTGPFQGHTVSGTGTLTADDDQIRLAVPESGQPPVSWLIHLPGNLRFNGITTTATSLTLSVSGFDINLG